MGAHATLDAAKRAADVRAGLDEETLAHLEKYTEIYNKYAAEYGDGFELDATTPDSVTEAFQLELYEAKIPGCGKRVTVEDYEVGNVNFVSPLELYEQYNATVPALFYAEKYGLAGLSKEEQCKAVLHGQQTGTANNLREAVSTLYRIGAISFRELVDMNFFTSNYAAKDLEQGYTQAEFEAALDTPMDWSGLLEQLKGNESAQSLYEMLSAAWETQSDAEDEKLEAMMEKIDQLQEAIRERIQSRIEKQQEQRIISRAEAEGIRLRVLFGLDSWADISDTALEMETAIAEMSVL